MITGAITEISFALSTIVGFAKAGQITEQIYNIQ